MLLVVLSVYLLFMFCALFVIYNAASRLCGCCTSWKKCLYV